MKTEVSFDMCHKSGASFQLIFNEAKVSWWYHMENGLCGRETMRLYFT